MYADVVVLTYQAPDIGVFTYQIPHDLENIIKIGHLVEVPFGNRSPQGIVIGTKVTKPEGIQVRPIIRQSFPEPLLLAYQIELLKWMSSYYQASIVNCLKAILPELPRKLLIVNSQSKSTLHSPFTIHQTIVLVPSINRIAEILARFPQAKNYVLFHNQLKTSEIFSAWLKIISSEVDYIFGARRAIFAPCPNPSKIIIFEEHDGAYKDERSPYFDTLTIAEKIQDLTDANIEIIDSSPKLTTYFTHKNELQVPKLISNTLKINIVSMVGERNAGNKSPISNLLSSLLVKTYKQGGKSLLFLNKKIESGQFYCRNCQHQAYVKTKPANCPNCNSSDLFFYSLNIASLSNLVREIIPSVPIKLIAEGISPALTIAPVQIATSTIFYAQTVTRYDLVGHIAVDNVVNIPDFNSAEKTYAQIINLKKITAKNGVLILQTYNPQSLVIKSAVYEDYKSFSNEQFNIRKALFYPPYSLLVKLTIRGKNQDKIQRKAESMYEELAQYKDKNTLILGPYQPFFGYSTPRYNIILKKKMDSYTFKSREKAVNDLSDLLKLVDSEWQITVDPESLN